MYIHVMHLFITRCVCGHKYIFLYVLWQVMKALRETEQHNARLHEYIEGLLVTIIEKHPELLERR